MSKNQISLSSADQELLKMIVARSDLIVPRGTIDQLIKYLELLQLWNLKIALYSRKLTTAELLTKHILDALVSCSALKDYYKILDIGSGNGIPGIILSIVFPEKHFTLCEIDTKKTAFLRHIKNTLKLDNITIAAHSFTELNPQEFDLVTSKAFMGTNKLFKLMLPKNYLTYKTIDDLVEINLLRTYLSFNLDTTPNPTHPNQIIYLLSNIKRVI